MDILHFEDLAENEVALVIGGYRISIAKYLRGISGASTLIQNLKEIGLICFELECSRRLGLRADAAMLKP